MSPPVLLPAPPRPRARPALREEAWYWLGWPLRWLGQMLHNGHGICRVLDITRFRPLPAGLVTPDHPWSTGTDPGTGEPVWHRNVIFRSARPAEAAAWPDDEVVVAKTCQFMADRVAQSAVVPEIPTGPRRRMPHGINYIHGTSHYNSGLLVFNDFRDALRHVTDRRFRLELLRFVREQRREVLFVFRDREYRLRDFAYFVCAMRTLFPWFCNSNGPKGRVLWGNASPFPAANLITGAWVRDVYALKRPGGARAVVRPAVPAGRYFTAPPYDGGREAARFPEKLLAWGTYYRIRVRGGKGGMFFVDRRKAYAEQLELRKARGLADEPLGRM